jgi:hypothetical protein
MEELEAQELELLPAREEMNFMGAHDLAASNIQFALSGSVANNNQQVEQIAAVAIANSTLTA